MSKVVKLVAALFVLAALMGAKCSKVDSNRPTEDRQVDPKRERVVQIRANGDAPYTAFILAHDARKPGLYDRVGPEHVAGGEFVRTLTYTSGLRIDVKISVEGHPTDRFTCAITDGQYADRQSGVGVVVCQLTTGR